MTTSTRQGLRRLFAGYGAVSLVPVGALGGVLATMTSAQADSRGLAQTRGEAALFARTVVAPLLTSRPLTMGRAGFDTAG